MVNSWVKNKDDGSFSCTACGATSFDPGRGSCECPVGGLAVQEVRQAEPLAATARPPAKDSRAPSARRMRARAAAIAGALIELAAENKRVADRMRRAKNNKEAGRLASVSTLLERTAKMYDLARKAVEGLHDMARQHEDTERELAVLARKERLANGLAALRAGRLADAERLLSEAARMEVSAN